MIEKYFKRLEIIWIFCDKKLMKVWHFLQQNIGDFPDWKSPKYTTNNDAETLVLTIG